MSTPYIELILGNDDSENRRAKDLVERLEPFFDVDTIDTSGIPFYEKEWAGKRPAVLVESKTPGMGGGGMHGIDGIQSFVELELEKHNGEHPDS
jgi:hypothetical protein